MCAGLFVYVEDHCGVVSCYLYHMAGEETFESSKGQEFKEIDVQTAFFLYPLSVCHQLVDMRSPTCWTGICGYLYFLY